MKNKEDLRIMKTKASLYRNIISLMKKKAYNEINISEICSKSKINRSTFYDHFKDKNDLLQSLINDMTKELEKNIRMDNNINHYFKNLLIILLDHIEENKNTYRTILNTNYASIIKESLIKMITNCSKKEMEKVFPKASLTLIEKYAIFYTSGIINIMINELKNNKEFNKDYLYELLLTILPKKIIIQ